MTAAGDRISASAVLEKLRLLTVLTPQTEPLAQLLCEQAALALSARLAVGACPADPRLTFAAAALAGSWLTKSRCAGETLPAFRAGDVSVTPVNFADTQSRLCQTLLEEALTQAAPLLRDDGFAFWQIGGP
ncbi:MAG TPA: hypothetical protein IAD07_04690 [Candidatus Fimivicinus intestinavium]|nr:hypothetical protein [Candidatus Fimivicinus intestinavium]